ncbi:zinc-dependent alcohol dehydrogenase family protein [Kribbella sp. NBC_01505]|uniref:zinc-dependent alcohol dehydrogenase family protein n=1 Tax=Kribbella sp. NBC_01505 TaxID=2903580 RepID=UPI00386365C8
MKVVLKARGELLDNAVLETGAGTLGPDDVVVAIEVATINPVDSMLASGNYGYQIETPFDLGTEGIGRVTQVGSAADASLHGRRVLIKPNYEQGTWADEVVVKAANVVPITDEGDPLQLAMLGTNPLTAHLALTKFVDLKPGDWVGLNLGNSAVGQYVIALAKHAGYKTLAVVRRPEAAEGLQADVVLVDGDDLSGRIRSALGTDRFELVLDGAGDATVGALAQWATFGGTVVSYSSVTGQTPAVGLGDHIYRQLQLRGLWIPNWLEQAPVSEIQQTYDALAQLTVDRVLQHRVEAVYPVAEYAKAVEHSQQPGRKGKVLLRP